MSEHTKTPWEWQLPNGKFISNEPFDLDCEDYGTTSSAIVADGKVVCIVPEAHNGDWEDGERHANLLHIVHCVNNHERLVNNLKSMVGQFDAEECNNSETDWMVINEARTLLAALEAEKGGES